MAGALAGKGGGEGRGGDTCNVQGVSVAGKAEGNVEEEEVCGQGQEEEGGEVAPRRRSQGVADPPPTVFPPYADPHLDRGSPW